MGIYLVIFEKEEVTLGRVVLAVAKVSDDEFRYIKRQADNKSVHTDWRLRKLKDLVCEG